MLDAVNDKTMVATILRLAATENCNLMNGLIPNIQQKLKKVLAAKNVREVPHSFVLTAPELIGDEFGFTEAPKILVYFTGTGVFDGLECHLRIQPALDIKKDIPVELCFFPSSQIIQGYTIPKPLSPRPESYGYNVRIPRAVLSLAMEYTTEKTAEGIRINIESKRTSGEEETLLVLDNDMPATGLR